MRRPTVRLVSLLLVGSLAACGTAPSPGASGAASTSVTASQEPPAPASPGVEPSSSPAPNIAAGLAFVRLVGSVQQVFVVHDDGEIAQLTNFDMPGHAGGAGLIAWSPDGTHLAVALGVSVGVQIVVVDAVTGTIVDLGTGGGGVPSWSPDGTRLAYTAPFDVVGPGARIPVFVATPASGAVEEVGWGFAPVWHPSGERVVVKRSEGETETQPGRPVLDYLEADGSGESRFLDGYLWATWAPDGQRLALAQGFPPALLLADADGANPVPLASGTFLAWSPDGTRLAYTEPASSTVVIVDVAGGQSTSTGISGGPAAWSPDGELVAIGSYDPVRGASVVVLVEADTGIVVGQVDGLNPAWAP